MVDPYRMGNAVGDTWGNTQETGWNWEEILRVRTGGRVVKEDRMG